MPYIVSAQEGEMDELTMLCKNQDLVTPSRTPKLKSQVADNITVIDSNEIEAINAHTLADVLYYVTGVQVDINGGPGSATSVLIQGSDPSQVRVVVDGVTLNNLGDNVPDIGAFPVQQIERIEIIKGPASSAWGSSLGGIINIITKSPDPNHKAAGLASASMGNNATGDFRAELSGTEGNLGYYLFGGGITSDGLTTYNGTGKSDFYTKLNWKPSQQARAQLTVGYDKGFRGEGAVFGLYGKDSFEYFFASPSFSYDINDNLNFDVSARVSTKRSKNVVTGIFQEGVISDELSAGGSAKLNWHACNNTFLIGTDYDNGTLDSANILNNSQSQERWALFANDTLLLGDFAITPGVRYDYTSTNGDFLSPSLGVTYTLLDKTILRWSVARGFNIPSLGDTFGNGISAIPNPNLKPENIWSYQFGVETSAPRYFLFKLTGFIHDIHNVLTTKVLSPNTFQEINSSSQRRQGVEAELKTISIYHTALSAGYVWMDINNRSQGEGEILPHYTYDVGIDYNDNNSLRGALRGHYTWWYSETTNDGKYNNMIWDLNLSKRVMEHNDKIVEIFFSAHNLFNGAQYSNGFFPNPQRWFEGGMRYMF